MTPSIITNEAIKQFLKNSSLNPYLIHIECEIENILMNIKTDPILREIIFLKYINLDNLELVIKNFLKSLRILINITKLL